jgi:hypothetical protein
MLGKLKEFIDLTGSPTRDLPACSIMPQPTTLPREETEAFELNCWDKLGQIACK